MLDLLDEEAVVEVEEEGERTLHHLAEAPRTIIAPTRLTTTLVKVKGLNCCLGLILWMDGNVTDAIERDIPHTKANMCWFVRNKDKKVIQSQPATECPYDRTGDESFNNFVRWANQKLEEWRKTPEAANFGNRKNNQKPADQNKKNNQNSNKQSGGQSGGGNTPKGKSGGGADSPKKTNKNKNDDGKPWTWKGKTRAQMVCKLDEGRGPQTVEEARKLIGLQDKRTKLLKDTNAPEDFIEMSKNSSIVFQQTAMDMAPKPAPKGAGKGKK